METILDMARYALPLGAGATAVMDLWTAIRRRWLGIPFPDYALVGRWIAWMARGRFRHDRIAAAPAVRGERWLGWASHYLIGAAFAMLLLAVAGLDWARDPTPAPALAVGIATVLAPFLVMQPGMGAGFAARRTPRPASARWQSLVNHAVFGLGLYLAGLFISRVA